MEDYKKLNLKCGLEIHRQMDTHKLFCNCPSILSGGTPNSRIKRNLHAVDSERGEKDLVALFEMKKNKYAIYETFDESSCLVELDEEPPHPINLDALNAALEVSLLLNAKVVDEIHVMRKQVLDFSNTSGFQRTALVAVDGYMRVKDKEISIPTICLEEDAARRIKNEEDHVIFRLDRLGVPLIEIASGPEITTPEEAKEVAKYLGMLLKSTGRFKTGIGTIRQDVNLSINKGARVELKGFQDLKNMPNVIDNEIKRQLSLINKGEKVKEEVRKVNVDNTTTFLRPMPSASRMYPETDISPMKIDNPILRRIVLPELITEKILNVEKKFCLRHEIAQEVVEREIDLGSLSKVYKNIEPRIIADILIEIPKEIKSRFKIDSEIKKMFMDKLFDHLNEGSISRDSVIEILVDHCNGKEVNFNNYRKVSDKEIENEIKKIISNKKDLSPNAVMGIIMSKYKGKVAGQKVFELINKNKA